MKLLLIFSFYAIVIVAVSHHQWNEIHREEINEDSYRTQRVYHYLYKGQISNGLSKLSEQNAITRIEAQISLAFPNNERNALLRLERIRFGSLNEELPDANTLERRFEIFDENNIEEENERLLRLPIRFKYYDGLISEIEFDRDDEPWSENIKRAILNLLQVNMKKNTRTDLNEERRSLNNYDTFEDHHKRRENTDFFTAREETLEGECEVFYTINKLRNDENDRNAPLRVTKSINFDKCSKRIEVRYNHRFGEKCAKCNDINNEERITKSTTIFNYKIIGNTNRFLVKNAEVKSHYVHLSFDEEDTTMKSIVVGRLDLLKVTKDRVRWNEPRSERKQSIIYSPESLIKIERFYMNGDEELRRDHPFRKINHKYELIEQTAQKMIRSMANKELGIEPDATHQMTRLVEVLAMCSKQELLDAMRRLCQEGKFDEKTQKKVCDIFVDALALAATKNTIEVLVEQIEQRKITTLKAAMAIKALVNVKVISEKQINTLFNLCKKDICERSPLLKQSCFLTVGTMINALCKESRDRLAVQQTNERLCPRTLKENYLKELMEIFRRSETRYEKILALKTLANTGIDLSIYEFERLIIDRSQERFIRVQAIDALRQLRITMPRKIQRILMPIFKDKSEHPEIRIAAFTQIMQTLPERALLDQLAETLLYERSHQVQSFTYSMMRTFANSKGLFEKRFSEDLQASLRLAHIDTTNWSDSKYIHVPFYKGKNQIQLSMDLASIFTKDSALPRELTMKFETIIAEQWRKTNLQFGIIQYNLEEIIEKLAEETREKSLEEIIVRQRRDTSFRPTDILRSLYEKLNIRSRNTESNPYGMGYVRYKNLDYAILPFDDHSLPETLKIINDGKIDLARFEEYFTRGCRFHTYFATFIHDLWHRIPTTLGIPLIIGDRMPIIVGLEGEFRGALMPRQSNRLSGANVDMKIKSTIATTHVFVMRTWNPILSSGIKMVYTMKVNLPIDAQFELAFNKKLQLKYKLKIPEEKKQIFALQTHVATYTSSWSIDPTTYVEPKMRTVHVRNERRRQFTFEKIFGEKFMDIRVNIRGQLPENPLKVLQQSPMLFIAGNNGIEITMERTHNTPNEVVTEFDIEMLKESRMQRPTFERFRTERIDERIFDSGSDEESEENSRENNEYEARNKDRYQYSRNTARKSTQRNREDDQRRRQEVTRYMREYNPKRGYKLHVQMRINTFNGRMIQRKLEAEISTGCDEKMRYCMLNAYGNRVPIFENERRQWTFKTNIETFYPERVRTIKELNEKKHREFNALIEHEWGADTKEYLNMKIQGEQNYEQKELMNQVSKQLSPIDRYNEILAATSLNQYKIIVDYDLRPPLMNCFNNIFEVLKSHQLWNLRMRRAENPEKKIFAKITIDPYTHRFITFVVETPNENVEIGDMRLPIKIAPFALNAHRPSYPLRSLPQFMRKMIAEDSAECLVRSNRVNTFDNVAIELPLTTCYTVLAKDCRSTKPRFAVLMKKVRKGSEEKKMKIIEEERIIDLERINGDIKVKIDGRMENNEETLEMIGISKNDAMIFVEHDYMTIHFDGETASIRVSSFFKNGQCGICGHYDGEKDDELRKADNELTDDIEEYHRSYFANDNECDIEEDIVSKKTNYGIRFNGARELFEESEEEEEEQLRKPIMRTHMIEYNHEICFSKSPMPKCPEGTYMKASDKHEMRMSFVCFSRSSHETSRLARRANIEILNMDNYTPNFVDTLVVPRSCVVF